MEEKIIDFLRKNPYSDIGKICNGIKSSNQLDILSLLNKLQSESKIGCTVEPLSIKNDHSAKYYVK